MRTTARRVVASAVILAFGLAGCGGPAKPPGTGTGVSTGTSTGTSTDDLGGPTEPPPQISYRTLDAEAEVTTGWGAITKVPAGWHVAESPDAVRVQSPDHALSVGLVAVEAVDAAAARAAAWQIIDPTFALALGDASAFPGRDGWDEVAQADYVTPPEQARVVIALARRKGATWHVAILDGTAAAFGARGAQASSIVLDMKVPGVVSESLAGKPAQLDAERLRQWDAFVEEARIAAGVPGLAVAIVHGGKIVFEAGHGVKQVGAKGKPAANAVAPSTLFMIGSITKSLTTLLIAGLVDRGKVTWEQAVVDVLPSFALADAELTRQVTLRHTGCACTGLPRQDLEMVFEFAGWTPEQRIASMATMTPTTGFGETFQYSNLLVALGGYAAAHAYAPKQKLGPAYAKALQDVVLGPLGMKTATLDRKRALKGDAARPHARGLTPSFAPVPIETESFVDPVAPAGALWASVRDMAQFMLVELARGKNAKGKQLFTEANLLERRKPQIAIGEDQAYGLGLIVGEVLGLPMLTHSGGTAGFNTNMLVLPEQDLGLIILTNGNDAGAVVGAATRRFFELVFGAEERAAKELAEQLARSQEALATELAMHAPPDDAWVTPLLGTYAAPGLGTIVLRKDGAKVVLDAGEWRSAIAKKTDRAGTVKVITVEGAFATLELIPRIVDGQQTLVLDAGQQVYTFVPVAR